MGLAELGLGSEPGSELASGSVELVELGLGPASVLELALESESDSFDRASNSYGEQMAE